MYTLLRGLIITNSVVKIKMMTVKSFELGRYP